MRKLWATQGLGNHSYIMVVLQQLTVVFTSSGVFMDIVAKCEISRVLLLMLLEVGPNISFLDEVTNQHNVLLRY